MCIGAPDRRKFFCDKELSLVRRTSPMPTECIPTLFGFAPLEGRKVVAGFDGGAITSDAGGLLLGATDKVLGLTRRIAACFQDHRDLRWSRRVGQIGGMDKLGSGCRQAANLSTS